MDTLNLGIVVFKTMSAFRINRVNQASLSSQCPYILCEIPGFTEVFPPSTLTQEVIMPGDCLRD
jgi:hypothetical protein